MRSGYGYYATNLLNCFASRRRFRGWGRKRSGRFAAWCHNRFGGELVLHEDGFIRSIGLGIDGSPAFSIVEDDVGIYYDAGGPSRLENFINTYNFAADIALMAKANEAIRLIKTYRISKYNHAPDIAPARFKKNEKRVLVSVW